MWHFKGFDFISVTKLSTINFYQLLQKNTQLSIILNLHMVWDAVDFQTL